MILEVLSNLNDFVILKWVAMNAEKQRVWQRMFGKASQCFGSTGNYSFKSFIPVSPQNEYSLYFGLYFAFLNSFFFDCVCMVSEVHVVFEMQKQQLSIIYSF